MRGNLQMPSLLPRVKATQVHRNNAARNVTAGPAVPLTILCHNVLPHSAPRKAQNYPRLTSAEILTATSTQTARKRITSALVVASTSVQLAINGAVKQ